MSCPLCQSSFVVFIGQYTIVPFIVCLFQFCRPDAISFAIRQIVILAFNSISGARTIAHVLIELFKGLPFANNPPAPIILIVYVCCLITASKDVVVRVIDISLAFVMRSAFFPPSLSVQAPTTLCMSSGQIDPSSRKNCSAVARYQPPPPERKLILNWGNHQYATEALSSKILKLRHTAPPKVLLDGGAYGSPLGNGFSSAHSSHTRNYV